MASIHKDELFKDIDVHLDGGHFQNCRFVSCQMTFGGGALPSLQGCHFDGCSWHFVGAAANTLQLLTALKGGGFEMVVADVLSGIEAGRFAGPPEKNNDEAREQRLADKEEIGSAGKDMIDLGFGKFPIPKIVRKARVQMKHKSGVDT